MVVQLKGSSEVPELVWVSLVYRQDKESLVIWDGNRHGWETLCSDILGYLYRKRHQRFGALPNGCWAIPPMCVEVEGLGYWVAEGIGYGGVVGIGCWALDPTISRTEVTIGGMLCEAFPMAIWSRENVHIVLTFWSKSLKLFKFGNGSPTKGVPRGAWTWVGVSCILTG